MINLNLLQVATPGMNHHELIFSFYIPVGIWLLGILILFIFLLKKYTFGNWTEQNPNPYKTETLGMPIGIFRGLITMSLLYVVIIFEVMNIRLGRDESNIREFMIAFQMMIAFYFGSKVLHHYASVDSKKAKAKAESNVAIASVASNIHTSPNSGVAATPTVTNPVVNPNVAQANVSNPSTEEAVG